MNGNFFAMMSRMKYIERWALMKNTSSENVSEHSLEVGMIAHALAVIGNSRFNKKIYKRWIRTSRTNITKHWGCNSIIIFDRNMEL